MFKRKKRQVLNFFFLREHANITLEENALKKVIKVLA